MHAHGGAGIMLACECGSHAIEITEAEGSPDENGFVESFWERYHCELCDRTGTYVVNEDGSDRLTGCLTRVDGGVW